MNILYVILGSIVQTVGIFLKNRGEVLKILIFLFQLFLLFFLIDWTCFMFAHVLGVKYKSIFLNFLDLFKKLRKKE